MKFDALCETILNEGKNNQRDYKFYVATRGKIESGWEYKEDAEEHLEDLPPKAMKGAKILQARGLKKLGLNPNKDADWATHKDLTENEGDDGDEKIETRKELLSYTTKLAKAAFGDKIDMEKVKGIVDNAIGLATKKEGGDVDWEEAAGIVTGSFND